MSRDCRFLLSFQRYIFLPSTLFPSSYHDEYLNERADRLRAQLHVSVKAGRTNLVDTWLSVTLVENSSADRSMNEYEAPEHTSGQDKLADTNFLGESSKGYVVASCLISVPLSSL
ncbi:hypothetical protein EDD37DRAFT_83245 [Exophiala viscosa]|uniref:uncharacterized protein n=1 Tax=Exophiala viscosa TaxID=2486360 RepID=UPI002197AB24|nr:hypothetical protein EDD37DRAFT_83245 [Exophiala viscosa]